MEEMISMCCSSNIGDIESLMTRAGQYLNRNYALARFDYKPSKGMRIILIPRGNKEVKIGFSPEEETND